MTVTANEGAYAFQALLRHDRTYTGYTKITGTPWFAASRNAARSLNYSGPSAKLTDTSELLDEFTRCRRRSGPPGCGVWSPTRSA